MALFEDRRGAAFAGLWTRGLSEGPRPAVTYSDGLHSTKELHAGADTMSLGRDDIADGFAETPRGRTP